MLACCRSGASRPTRPNPNTVVVVSRLRLHLPNVGSSQRGLSCPMKPSACYINVDLRLNAARTHALTTTAEASQSPGAPTNQHTRTADPPPPRLPKPNPGLRFNFTTKAGGAHLLLLRLVKKRRKNLLLFRLIVPHANAKGRDYTAS